MPTPEEMNAARERALEAHFRSRDARVEDWPAIAEAFRDGWEAARFAFFPQHFITGPGENLIDASSLAEMPQVITFVPPPPAGLAGPQLRALADGIRRRFPPPDVMQRPGEYVRNEAMMVLAAGLDDLAHAEDEQ